MKPGYQTTEFWTAVAPIVGSLTVKINKVIRYTNKEMLSED
jgi:hypothetical protein